MNGSVYEYTVIGSKGDQYKVTLLDSSAGILANCTCRGAEMNNFCKHIISICNSDAASLVANSALERDLIMLNDAEKCLSDAKLQVKKVKSNLKKYLKN